METPFCFGGAVIVGQLSSMAFSVLDKMSMLVAILFTGDDIMAPGDDRPSGTGLVRVG